mgnify:CR=1 FL=1
MTNITPLVDGIENLQIDYGVDTNSDGNADSYAADPASVTNWSNVVSVQIHLLARNTETSLGYTDTKTYNLGPTGLRGWIHSDTSQSNGATGRLTHSSRQILVTVASSPGNAVLAVDDVILGAIAAAGLTWGFDALWATVLLCLALAAAYGGYHLRHRGESA